MGGYGGESGNVKGKCYFDTGGKKVKDKNAIEVAEEYISEGKYVAFLQEKEGQRRADLSVDGQHVEVKGITSLNPDNIESRIIHGCSQIEADKSNYPNTYILGKVVILSKHDTSIDEKIIIKKVTEAFHSAQRKGLITGTVELWIRGKRIIIK